MVAPTGASGRKIGQRSSGSLGGSSCGDDALCDGGDAAVAFGDGVGGIRLSKRKRKG
jgi:hypothetical protein